MVVESETMRKLMDQVRRLAESGATVLITGETGTGKELVARALHHYAGRASGPWVDLSCTTLPDHLLESELFGYERGAFSGAHVAKPGLFELARHGTLFLDEVGDLDGRAQSKLLRAMDGAGYFRLGGTRKVSIETRVVAATNRNLTAAVASGQFREDLYHRLNQLSVEVPPLRQRKNDILPLADFFLAQVRPGCVWSAEAAMALESYSWPGNVRQLRNVVLKTAILAEDTLIPASLLPLELGLEPAIVRQDTVSQSLVSLAACLERSEGQKPNGAAHGRHSCNLEAGERRMIELALRETGGHQQRAAQILGISRRTLNRKLKLYGSPLSQATA